MESELLIATNGFKGTWAAIEYGAWLAEIHADEGHASGCEREAQSPRAIDDRSSFGGYLRKGR